MRAALLLASAAVAMTAAASAAAQQDGEEYGGLPPGEGRDVVFGVCTACHSAKLITQQGMTRERWANTIDWMQEEQGMAELPEETIDAILDYLAEHFPAEGPGRPSTTRPATGLRVQPLIPLE